MRPRNIVAAAVLSSSLMVLAPGRATAGAPSGPALQQATPPTAAQSGASLPKPIRQVKPAYTAEAMRAKIDGSVVLSCVVQADGSVTDVRVLKSLDPGLDEEAVKAARQWRFVPGMKDGVAVPVQISLELSFHLAGAPRAALAGRAWPASFSEAGGPNTPRSDWRVESVSLPETDVQVIHPPEWTLHKDGVPGTWVDVRGDGGSRVMTVGPPRGLASQLPLLATQFKEQADGAIKRRLAAMGSGATLAGTGEVEANGRVWLWFELSVPAGDPAISSEAAPDIPGSHGVRAWMFLTTTRTTRIEASCFVVHAAGVSEFIREDATAGRQFEAMIRGILINDR